MHVLLPLFAVGYQIVVYTGNTHKRTVCDASFDYNTTLFPGVRNVAMSEYFYTGSRVQLVQGMSSNTTSTVNLALRNVPTVSILTNFYKTTKLFIDPIPQFYRHYITRIGTLDAAHANVSISSFHHTVPNRSMCGTIITIPGLKFKSPVLFDCEEHTEIGPLMISLPKASLHFERYENNTIVVYQTKHVRDLLIMYYILLIVVTWVLWNQWTAHDRTWDTIALDYHKIIIPLLYAVLYVILQSHVIEIPMMYGISLVKLVGEQYASFFIQFLVIGIIPVCIISAIAILSVAHAATVSNEEHFYNPYSQNMLIGVMWIIVIAIILFVIISSSVTVGIMHIYIALACIAIGMPFVVNMLRIQRHVICTDMWYQIVDVLVGNACITGCLLIFPIEIDGILTIDFYSSCSIIMASVLVINCAYQMARFTKTIFIDLNILMFMVTATLMCIAISTLFGSPIYTVMGSLENDPKLALLAVMAWYTYLFAMTYSSILTNCTFSHKLTIQPRKTAFTQPP